MGSGATNTWKEKQTTPNQGVNTVIKATCLTTNKVTCMNTTMYVCRRGSEH